MAKSNQVENGTKPCYCLFHNGERIPISRFRKRKRTNIKTAHYVSKCRAWEIFERSKSPRPGRENLTISGYIPANIAVRNIFLEIENRVGRAHGARLTKMTTNNFVLILSGKRKAIQAYTLVKALRVRDELRKKNIVYHRKDIKYGTLARGKELKFEVHGRNGDYYNAHDDKENEVSREKRRQGGKLKGKFLCGCDPDKVNFEPDYSADIRNLEENSEHMPMRSRMKKDAEGYAICPNHEQRMYGWRNIMKQGAQGNDVIDYHAEFMRGKKAVDVKKPIEGNFGVVDIKDNRDPEELGLALLTERGRFKGEFGQNGPTLQSVNGDKKLSEIADELSR